jgi:hypothetical protein
VRRGGEGGDKREGIREKREANLGGEEVHSDTE